MIITKSAREERVLFGFPGQPDVSIPQCDSTVAACASSFFFTVFASLCASLTTSYYITLHHLSFVVI